MSFLTIIWIVTLCVLGLLIRSKIRADHLQKDQAHRANSSAIHSSTSEAGHSHTYFVTKDPDAYARIFVPTDAKK